MAAPLDDLLDTSDATALAAAIRSGEVTAPEVVAAAIERAEARNPALNAFVDTRFDQALEDAATVDPDAPFAGVPFVVKDLGQEVAGLRHTRGSRLFADVRATEDSELVKRYRRAGFIILGTTNTPELGKNASTESMLHGPARNPHNLGYSTGGSSGGTAAAIAAGIVPIGHGNDGGGSIRIPAAACGLFGLKPSRGRVTNYPAKTLLAYPMGIDHVLTRSVRDSAAVLDATAGAMPGDPYQIVQPTRPWADEVGAAVPKLKVGLALETPKGESIDPQVAAVVSSLADTLADLGHEVVDAAPTYPVELMATVMQTIMGVPTALLVDRYLAELGRELQDDDLETLTRMMYDRAHAVTGIEIIEVMQSFEDIGRTIGAFWADHDLLLTATLGAPVPELGKLDTMDIPTLISNIGPYSSLTSPFNMTGQPAVSLPLGHDDNGLPVGVQLVGAFGREDLLVAVSSQVEAARPWSIAPAWPPTHGA